MKFLLSLLAILAASAAAQERTIESVLPALAYGPRCSSTVQLQNLSDRWVIVDVEGHRASGALVPAAGHPEIAVHLGPRERVRYELAERNTMGQSRLMPRRHRG